MNWKMRLEPFARLYADLDQKIESMVEAMPDEDVKKLRDAADRPDSTNCWWATYDVRGLVKRACNIELERRRRQRRLLRGAGS